jgi:hypothetical protein
MMICSDVQKTNQPFNDAGDYIPPIAQSDM